MASKLSEEAKKIITEVHPGFIATASKNGKPSVSPKGSFRVLDDSHVLFVDQGRAHTLTNLRENPQVAALVFNPANRQCCRVWGEAEILESGQLYDTIAAESAARGRTARFVVRVTVKEVETF